VSFARTGFMTPMETLTTAAAAAIVQPTSTSTLVLALAHGALVVF
jgi:hypothetical protein